MRSLRFVSLQVLAGAFFCITAVVAQNSAPAVRIVNPIDENQRVTLGGTVHPLANAKNDRGVAPDSTPLDRMHLLLKRSAGQQASLDQLVGQLHTQGNPSYHKWLTPDEFGKQFGPSDQDIATVETWLTSHGFNVTGVKPGKQVIEFSGNVGQLRGAFHTEIHQYSVNGENHFANATNPQIPAALAPVVAGFVSLNNFHAKNQVKNLGKVMYDTTTHQGKGDWTWGTATGGVNFVLAPQDYAVQYDLNALYNATTPINGSGQTIAIINDSNVNINLVNQFRTLFSLPANPPQVIIDGNDPGVNGDSVEAYLDVEWAGAVAPDATIDLVIGASTELEDGLYLAAEHAVYGNVAPVMSISFGECEQGLGSYNGFWSNLWEQAAAQGTTVMVSSGDAGSAGCDDDNTAEWAQYGQNVNGFASTPYNVAVGGTDFYYSFWNSGSVTLSSFSPYWSTSPQATPAASLKAYLTEQPWNNSQFGDDVSAYYADSSDSATTIAGGSGGASNSAVCSTGYSGSSCSGTLSGYAKPSWQTGTGVPADKVRDLPDVSLFAANGYNYSFYALCAVDGDCQPATGGNVIQISGVGGTSASSPSFAGIMALVNQKYGPQGQANFVLYPLAKQFPKSFHDVTVGSNTEPCDLSDATPNCITAPSGLGYTVTEDGVGTVTEGEIGTGTTAEYNAGTGYDLASGLGTIDADVLVTNWGSVKFDSTTTTLTITPPGSVSLSSIPHGTTLTFSGTVTGTGTPKGDVALVTNSTEMGEQAQTYFTLSNGSYSDNTVNYLPGGTYDVWTQYGGDGTNALSSSTPVKITVNPESSELSLSVINSGSTISSGASVTYGASITLDGQPGPSGCPNSCPASYTYPTGTVAFTDKSTALNTAVVNAEGDAEYTLPTAFNVGSHSITAAYSGDNSYGASTAPAVTFTVTQDTPEVLITSPYTSYDEGVAETLSVLVEGLGIGVAPGGTVSLSGTPSALKTTSATLSAGVDPGSGTTVGLATFTIPAGATAGNYNIVATYTPNSASSTNYAGATSSTYVLGIVSGSGVVATTTTGTATATATTPNAAITVTGTVTAASGSAPSGDLYALVPILASDSTAEEGVVTAVALTQGAGLSSTFSFTVDSGSLAQGANQITLQYLPTQGSVDLPSTAVVTIGNPLADFSLISNAAIIPVVSNSGSTNINVASVNTFAGAVKLSCTVPSGWTCTIPSSETLTSGGFEVAALSVTAPKTATVGSYNVLITGKDSTGEYVHTLGLSAQVTSTAPGFALSNSGSVTVLPGATTGNTSAITVTPSNGFTGTVNLTCALTNPPGGITAPTCSVTNSVTISGTAAASGTLTINTTSTTTPGAYTMTVTGTDAATGKITSSTPVSVTVKTPPSFALTNSGAVTFQAGATTGNTATVTVTPAGGYTGTVGFTCAIAPTAANSPATCAISPVTVTGTSAVNATLTVSSTTGTTVGSYTATVTGADTVTSSITATTSLGVTLTAPPTPAITLTNSGAISFVAGATSGNTATITVTPSNAFTGIVDLTCAVTTTPASPTSPATCAVTPTVDITGTSALTGTLTVTTTSTTTTGAYGITVTGKDAATGKVSSSTSLTATVNAPPSFALTNSGAISLQAGAMTANTGTITVTPAGGFTGNVNLTCAVTTTITGPTSPASCAVTTPVDITGTTAGKSTLTITTVYATTIGAYTATVTGKDASTGKITSSTAVAVTVTAPPPPAIALTNSGAISFVAGATTGNTATITVTPSYGFTGVVNLTCAATTTPSGASNPAICGVTPSVAITGTGALTGTLTVTTTAATSTGAYVFTVTGKDALTGKVTGSTPVSVTVNPPASFALTNSGAITLQAGSATGNTATITVTPAGGFTGDVNLTCAVTTALTSPTSPATCAVTSPVDITGTTAGTATVTITTAYATTLGAYTATVTGKDASTGKIAASTAVVVTVTAPPPPAIALTSSAALTFAAGATSGDAGTITVTPSYGFTGLVNLTCAVTPAAASSPATCSASAVTIAGTAAQTSTVTVVTTGATTPGSYTATVTGKDALTGKVTGSTTVSVTVEGYSLSNNGPITFGAGLTSGNTATITVSPASGFASSVGLTCAVSTTISSPTDAPTCALASGSVAGGSGTDVVTLTSKADTTPGAYTVTVTGTSGAITETSMVAVTVDASYSATAGTVTPSSVTPGGSATSTITVTSGDGYAGSVTVTCALTTSPSGAAYLPTCAGPSTAIALSSSATSGTGTVTVSTTAATTSELVRPQFGRGRTGKGWLGAGGGAVLALMLFFGIPARRRSWRSMLGVLVLMVVLGSMAGCGGGGGGGGGGTAGTTAGSYTFTVTATGSPAQSTGNTTTFTVTVN